MLTRLVRSVCGDAVVQAVRLAMQPRHLYLICKLAFFSTVFFASEGQNGSSVFVFLFDASFIICDGAAHLQVLILASLL